VTDFIAYDELTWPDVAKLPRTIPLVIPLGSGYSQADLANSLGHPAVIAMLPEIPFGWRGSGLAVPEHTLETLLANLLDSLSEDGFTNVSCLMPQDTGISLGCRRIVLSHRSQYRHFTPQPSDADLQKVVIIPIGHTEQHGYHLPLSTDTLIIGAIAEGVTSQLPYLACKLPTWSYGVSTHRQAFAGTLNAGGRAFEDFWLAVLDVLVARGFQRMYLISGHGGNCSFLQNIVKYAGERHRRIFCATAWLYLSDSTAAKALEQHRESPIGGMGHACELETSLILHLRQDLVDMEKVVDEVNFITTPNYYMDWNEGGALIANPPWDDDTLTGAYGAGSLATAEKGRVWLQAAIEEKSAHVLEIHEQHQLREARRFSGYGLWGKSSHQDSK
jgi:creatinine amidohydrolase